MSDDVQAGNYAGALTGRRAQIFPELSQEQCDVVLRYGTWRSFPAGAVLFRQGERHISMYVVVSGTVEVSRGSVMQERVVGMHGGRTFTGDIGTIAGRASIATGRAVTDCEVIEVDEASLRILVVSEADLSELIMRAYILRRVGFINDEHGGVMLIGSRQSADTLRLREFLMRNSQPVAYFDLDEHSESTELMIRFGISAEQIPAVITPDGAVLVQPTNRAVADAVGLSPDGLNGKHFDLVVIGAGPGGLASAVYAASEGLNVAVLDAKAPGGQAGSSSKIENYFGFPTGISGRALAGRGLAQARKFGAEVAVPVEVVQVECGVAGHPHVMRLDSGERISSRALIISTGAKYRKPDLPNLEQFEGRGVYYNASFMEAAFCSGEEVVIVGGGNSAGQAAVFLASHAIRVHVLVRSEGLAASMSRYLIQRIEAATNIELHAYTTVIELIGGEHLERLRYQTKGAEPQEFHVRHLFLFLGAQPNTEWLGDCLALDDRKFILTGQEVSTPGWPLSRARHFLETSVPGIFAVGDVRSGSVKRVAAAVGEGSAAIQSLHQVLTVG